MPRTVIIRIPVSDYKEIKSIADKLNIRVGAAYQIWKRNNEIGFRWKEY